MDSLAVHAPDHTSTAQKSRIPEFTAELGEHLYRAELICYSSLFVVGVVQIIIRENFPQLQPPWPIIGIALMIVLFGVVVAPPLLVVIRVWKRPDSAKDEAHR
jgi:hypothetical protein